MKFWTVDAFTTTPFSGNPAAVTIVDEFPDESLMQKIAAEFNLSETTFLKKLDTTTYHIRWFTPTIEIKLCGHATLAAAKVLQEKANTTSPSLTFKSKSGDLIIDNTSEKIRMAFPAEKTTQIPIDPAITKALGHIPSINAAKGEHPDSFLMFEYLHESDITTIQPNFTQLANASPNAVIITAKAADVDYIYRVFAPNYGINEDPVTGSVQVLLADYWHQKTSRKTFHSKQASHRTGELYAEWNKDTVTISGEAVIVSETTLLV